MTSDDRRGKKRAMAIVYDREALRTTDTETGHYVTYSTANREIGSSYSTLHDGAGKAILGSEVILVRNGNTGTSGPVTRVRAKLLKTWIPTGVPTKPVCFQGPSPLLEE